MLELTQGRSRSAMRGEPRQPQARQQSETRTYSDVLQGSRHQNKSLHLERHNNTEILETFRQGPAAAESRRRTPRRGRMSGCDSLREDRQEVQRGVYSGFEGSKSAGGGV
jgi:hypothetical protein